MGQVHQPKPDEVTEYANVAAFPVTWVTGKIYVDISTAPATFYRWNGSAYVQTWSTATSPWGATTNVQYNDAGAFAWEDNFSWDKIAKRLKIYSTLGSELVTYWDFSSSSGWTGTNWTISGGKAQHTTSFANPLTRAITLEIGQLYKFCFDMLDWTAGTVTITWWSVTIASSIWADDSYAYYFRPTSTSTFSITPTTTFRGSIDNVSCKRLTNGELSVSWQGWFGDSANVSKVNSTSYPTGSTEHFGLINSTGSSSVIGAKFWATWKGSIWFNSSGGIDMKTTSTSGVSFYYGSTISSQSLLWQFTSSWIYVVGRWKFWSYLTAWSASYTPVSTMNVYGSSGAKWVYVSIDGYTLGAETYILADVSTAAWCNGTPTACSTYSDSSTCGSHSTAWCSWSGGDCSSQYDESSCNSIGYPCSWSDQADCSVFNGDSYNCSAYYCTYDYGTDCSIYSGDQMTCEWNGCTWDYMNMSTCSGTIGGGTCSGTYNTGSYSCIWWAYGTCSGTASCTPFWTEGACVAESGCTWSENMNMNLPLGSGVIDSGSVSRYYYIKKVAGSGGVVINAYSGDNIDWETTYTISPLYDAVHLYYFPLYAECSAYNNNQASCTALSGCTFTDPCPSYYDQMTCESNSCTWDSGSMYCYDSGWLGDCTGTYVSSKRWHAFGDKRTGTIFSQTANKTVASTTTATSIVGTGTGTVILPPNFSKVGSIFELNFSGYRSSVSSATLQVIVKIGSTTLLDTGVFTANNETNARWNLEATITVRSIWASGTVFCQWVYTEVWTGALNQEMVKTATSTIDTTSAITFDVTVKWGTSSASNTITSTNGRIEAL